MFQTVCRSAVLCVLLGGLALAGCGKKPETPPHPTARIVAPARPAAVLPARLPGLWETQAHEDGSEDIQRLQICIDALTDARLGSLGIDFSADRCAPRTISRIAPDSWGLLQACPLPTGGTEEYSGSVTGDFSKAYSMKIRVQTTGAALPQMNRVANYIVESTRLGDCKPDQKPGDVINDGVTVNLFDMAGRQQP